MERILVVEDDKHISRLLKYNLEKSGYDVTVVACGEDALEVLDREQFNIIILDIMLLKWTDLRPAA